MLLAQRIVVVVMVLLAQRIVVVVFLAQRIVVVVVLAQRIVVVGFLAQRIVVIMVVVLLHRSSSIVIDAVNLVCVDHVLAPRIVQGLRVDHLQVVAHHQQLIVNNTVMMNMPTIAMTMM
jgi:hypothetical protein